MSIGWVLDKTPASEPQHPEVVHSQPGSRTTRKICTFYSRPGGCRGGDACLFQHVDGAVDEHALQRAQVSPGLPLPQQKQQQQQQQQQVCSFFSRGRCKAGAACAFLHGQLPEVALSRHASTGVEAGARAEAEAATQEPKEVEEQEQQEEGGARVGDKRKNPATTTATATAAAVLEKYSMRKFAKKVGGSAAGAGTGG